MEKLKVLFVGCGVISKPWIEYTITRDDVVIAGIVELNPAVAQAAKDKYNLSCPIFGDFEEALAKVKPDVVYDLTYVDRKSVV